MFHLLSFRCVYLVAELSKLDIARDHMKILIPLMAEATKKRNYSQYLQFYETVCKQVTQILLIFIEMMLCSCYTAFFYFSQSQECSCSHLL